MFSLSSEEIEIQESVRKIARSEIPRFQNESYYSTVPRELVTLFGEQGLLGLTISEKHGGLGRGALTASLVMEEVSYVDAGPAVFLSVHMMVAGLIQRFGTPEQKERYLPRMCQGELLGAFALTEPSAGSDAASLKTEARATGNGYSLTGEKCYITSAGWADLYLVFARTVPKSTGGDGISAFLVESKTPGLTIAKPEKKMGCELSPIASLTFSDAKIPGTALLGDLHSGYKVAMAGLNGGRVNIAAIANGISLKALDRAIGHLKERKQFGKPLIEFQGLQFMLADMKIKYEAARLLTLKAANIVETEGGGKSSNLFPSMAKCFATDSAMSIATDAVQLLGGAGYIKEYEVEKLMRDAKMMQIVEGANQIQRSVIARILSE